MAVLVKRMVKARFHRHQKIIGALKLKDKNPRVMIGQQENTILQLTLSILCQEERYY
jgi:hypothetical protein